MIIHFYADHQVTYELGPLAVRQAIGQGALVAERTQKVGFRSI